MDIPTTPQEPHTQQPQPSHGQPLVIGLIVLIVLLIAGGLFAFTMQRNAFQIMIEENNTQIEELKAMMEQEKEEPAMDEDETPTTEEKEEPNTQTMSYDQFMPAVFTPAGLYSDAEQTEITEKIIEPYKTYHYYSPSEIGHKPIAMEIKKLPPEDVAKHGFAYAVTVLWDSPGSESWLMGEGEAALPYWTPSCLGPCEYPGEFKQKYPELVLE